MLPDIHHVCWRSNKPTSETCWQKIVVDAQSCCVTLYVFMCVRERGGEAAGCVSVCAPTSEGSQQDLLVKGHGALACAAQHVPHCLIDGKSGEGIRHLRREERGGGERRGEEDLTACKCLLPQIFVFCLVFSNLAKTLF